MTALAGLGIAIGDAASAASPRSQTPSAEGVIAYKCGDGLCLTRPDGSGKRSLLRRGPWPQWDPAFAPSGSKLAFRGYYGLGDGEYALYVVGTNGCGVRRLTSSIAGDPSWSPNGRWIAFDTSGAGEIWKIHPDGTGLTRIAGGEAWSPAWSPDGTRIAFIRNEQGQGQVWVMRADGSAATRLHSDPGASDQTPAWSRDGSRIAFTVQESYPHSWIEVMSADGSAVRALTKRTGRAGNPVWLPGASIAFLAASDGHLNLYVMRPNGSRKRPAPRLRTVQFAWVTARLPRTRC